MNERIRAAVLASFAADSLALGPHWMYDVAIIKDRFGRVEQFEAPPEDGYHRNRKRGDQTHYGEQTLWLLESLADSGGFDLDAYADRWRRGFTDYDGYVDRATRDTLARFAEGKPPGEAGSDSDELSAAARCAPLLAAYRNRPESELVAAARAQTAMTHNQPEVLAAAEFFVRLSRGVLQGLPPAEAIRHLADNGFNHAPFAGWIEAGLSSIDMETREAISRFGKDCHMDSAFSCVIHLVGKYAEDLRLALIENVMAGGDSAARGLAAGMILGSHLGMAAIPEDWQSELNSAERIRQLLDRM